MNGHDEVCAPADTAFADAALAYEAVAPVHGREAVQNGESSQNSQCVQNGRNDLREPAAVLAARLAAHYRARRTLFDWMHPARLAALPYAARLRGLDGARIATLAEAFLADAGFTVPAVERFEPADAALALLPSPAVLAVFRLRALLDHAVEVQGWIDRPRRAVLVSWVGADGARLLLTRRQAFGAESSLAARLVHPPALDMQAGDALAWRGLRLFERECGWGADAPSAMLQLALPAAAADLPLARFMPPLALRVHDLGGLKREAPHKATRETLHEAPCVPSLAIVAQLSVLFPEATW